MSQMDILTENLATFNNSKQQEMVTKPGKVVLATLFWPFWGLTWQNIKGGIVYSYNWPIRALRWCNSGIVTEHKPKIDGEPRTLEYNFFPLLTIFLLNRLCTFFRYFSYLQTIRQQLKWKVLAERRKD